MSGNLKIDVRRKRILELLEQQGKVRVPELSTLLDATPVTIRSDLSALESEGYLQRVPGGAVQSARNVYHIDYLNRSRQNAPYKQALADMVASQIAEGETLFINSGATMVYVASALGRFKRLSVVTNSTQVALELGGKPGLRIVLLGGDINVQYAFTYGDDALRQLGAYKADHAILSIDGVHPEAGLTTYHAQEAPIDRMMMERARQTIIAADYTKLMYESFLQVAAVSQADQIVTNDCADPQALSALHGAGGRIVTCKMEGKLRKDCGAV